MDSFEVENFRSLKHLKLEKLARVNLLVGKNNSGKTSVLEALLTLRNSMSSDWLFAVEKSRGLSKHNTNYRYLFYGFSNYNKINLTATFHPPFPDLDDSAHLMHATMELRPAITEDFALRLTIDFGDLSNSFIFDIERNQSGQNHFIGISSEAKNELARMESNYASSPRPFASKILSASVDYYSLSNKLEILKFNKRNAPLLNTLQQVDRRITSIELGVGGQIYLDLGEVFQTLVPLNLVGEGVQRLIDIISGIAHGAGGPIFIDEIDNGLHYSALRILWKGILQAARQYDVQVFATTHSAEALRHLTWVLDDEEYKDYRDDVAAYTLIRAKDDTVRSFRYNYEQLDFAMEHDMEVRN